MEENDINISEYSAEKINPGGKTKQLTDLVRGDNLDITRTIHHKRSKPTIQKSRVIIFCIEEKHPDLYRIDVMEFYGDVAYSRFVASKRMLEQGLLEFQFAPIPRTPTDEERVFYYQYLIKEPSEATA